MHTSLKQENGMFWKIWARVPSEKKVFGGGQFVADKNKIALLRGMNTIPDHLRSLWNHPSLPMGKTSALVEIMTTRTQPRADQILLFKTKSLGPLELFGVGRC